MGLVPESEPWFDHTRQVPDIRGANQKSFSCLLGSDNVLEMVEMPCNSGWCWGQAVFANSLQSPQAFGPWVYFPGVA